MFSFNSIAVRKYNYDRGVLPRRLQKNDLAYKKDLTTIHRIVVSHRRIASPGPFPLGGKGGRDGGYEG